jgi:hypothetical protein
MRRAITSRERHVRANIAQASQPLLAFGHVSDEDLATAYNAMPAMMQVFFFRIPVGEARGLLRSYLPAAVN